MKHPRIILADDHTMMLDALESLIKPEFEVVGKFADGQALVEGAAKLDPTVIVLDIGMPTMNGLIAGQRLKQTMPLVKLVYLTMNHDPDMAGEAFRLGASAFLLKNSAAGELLRALREVVRGGFYVTPLMTKLPETLPTWLIKQEQLMPLGEALKIIHFPPSREALEAARRRLGFEEVFELTLAALLNKYELMQDTALAIGPWQAAVESCLATLGPPSGGGLGFLYATDHLAGALPSILAALAKGTGTADWVGTVGLGVAGQDASGAPVEPFDQPALAVMLADLPRDSYRLIDRIEGSAAAFAAAAGAWLAVQQPTLGLVHGDPRNPRSPAIVAELVADAERADAADQEDGNENAGRDEDAHQRG